MKLGFGLENALTMPTLLIIRNPEATLWTSTAGGLAYALQINFSLIVYFKVNAWLQVHGTPDCISFFLELGWVF